MTGVVRFGRGDVAGLARKARATLADDRDEKRRRELSGADAPALEVPDSFWCISYPIGWNVMRAPVRFELVTLEAAPLVGGLLRAQGVSVEQCEKRLRWAFASALMVGKHMRPEDARRRALRAHVHVAAQLDRRPEDAATAASLGRRADDDGGAA